MRSMSLVRANLTSSSRNPGANTAVSTGAPSMATSVTASKTSPRERPLHPPGALLRKYPGFPGKTTTPVQRPGKGPFGEQAAQEVNLERHEEGIGPGTCPGSGNHHIPHQPQHPGQHGHDADHADERSNPALSGVPERQAVVLLVGVPKTWFERPEYRLRAGVAFR